MRWPFMSKFPHSEKGEHFLPIYDCFKSPLRSMKFVCLAIEIVKSLDELHKNGIIHKDIKPENIHLNKAGSKAKIVGLTIASRLRQEFPAPRAPELIEGTLAYMSPEQTGRMNRSLDYRTDYYSLGITFYELLLGRLPFNADSATEWLHCHIARSPQPPHAVNPEIPLPLSNIVIRLIEKEPEDRYQSSEGLLADLYHCLNELKDAGYIAPFVLGRFDSSAKFKISGRLYGREQESKQLLRCFEKVIKHGRPEITLVTGYAGVGKTALVNKMQSTTVKASAIYVSGKFDQYHRDVPYSTIVSACDELVKNVLTQSEKKLNEWSTRILEAVGGAGRLVTDVLPQLELVIGPQPPVPALPLSEAQNRFNLVFQRFIGVFARREHPLVIFLDDLQWADLASLALLDSLLCSERNAYLFLVGAYRDNEVSPSHPLMMMLDHVRKNDVTVQTILLHPLSRKDLCKMLVDMLHMQYEQVLPLADLLFKKTAGNPFFAVRFLCDLYHARLLWFDHDERVWRWDRVKIDAQGYTDNVIDLMIISFRRMLPSETVEFLTLAACVGHMVDVGALSLISGKCKEDIQKVMQEAIEEGFVIQQNEFYVFAHDRIQQAAYSLISEKDRPFLHLGVGRVLLQSLPASEIDKKVFDIVPHFNQAINLIQEEEEILRVAELNLTAGRQAKASAAYVSAAVYFEAGLTLLGQQRWDSHYASLFALIRGLAECRWLSGHFEEAHKALDDLLVHATTSLDKAIAYQIKGDVYQTEGKVECAVDITILSLALFGVDVSAHPDWDHVIAEYSRVWELLDQREVEELLLLSPMCNADMQAVMSSLAALYAPAYFTDENLTTLVACKMVSLTFQFGTHAASPMGYAAFGRMLGPLFGRYQEGYRFGKLGYDLVERLNLVAYKARIVDLFGISTAFWVKPVAVGLEYSNIAYRAAIDAGDLTYACYACMHIPNFMWVKGARLEDIQQEAECRADYVRKAGYAEVADIITCIQRMVACLRGTTQSILTWSDERFNHKDFEKHIRENRSVLTLSWYQLLMCVTEVYTQQYSLAANTSQTTESLLSNTQLIYPEHFFYRALALAGEYDAATPSQQSVYLSLLNDYVDRFKAWANNNPANYQNKFALIAAEIARITGDHAKAMFLYDESIKSSRTHGFVQNEALGCERAAYYYRQRNLITNAEGYLNRALGCYQKWGAWGKVKQLYEQYPELSGQSMAPIATFLAQSDYFDVLSVSAASQAISNEMDLVKLQEILMRIVIEYSSADHVCLILSQGNDFSLQARAQVSSDKIDIDTALSESIFEGEDAFPLSILNYTIRSHEKVLIADASVHSVFSEDPYVKRCKVRSILCLPIIRAEKMVGMLLLENRLSAGVFTPAKLKSLELLAAQTAISLENAILFTNLQKSQAELQSILDNATAVIFTKDLFGRYILVNHQFEELFKVSRDKVIGKTDNEILPAKYAEIVKENDRRVIASGVPLTSEVSMPIDGEMRTFLAVKFPLRARDGEIYAVCGISSDITERKRSETILFEEKERAQVTLQSIGDAVITTDANGTIDYLNPVAQSLTGWSLEKAMGRPLMDTLTLVDESNEAPLPNPLTPALTEGSVRRLPSSCLLIQRDGTRIAIEDSAAPIRGRDGRIVGAVLVFHDVSESRKITAQLAFQATHDVLTGLPNRVLLLDRLEQAIVSAQRHSHMVGVLFLDLDRFKNVNDSLGHGAGDQLLKQVVARLSLGTRAEDTVSRQGGDEFIVLVPTTTHRIYLAELAENIRKKISLPFYIDGHELSITSSIGISIYPHDGDNAETIIKNADAAMYHAKATGRDNSQFYAAEMNNRVAHRLSIESDLRRALARDEFEVYYQPKVDVSTGNLIGAEALIRWNHPQLGMVGPSGFIGVAEESGLIMPIGKWIAEEVCRQNMEWLNQGLACVPIAVNLSGIQFRDKSLADTIKKMLENCGLPSHLFALELTESTIMEGAEEVVGVLGKLKDLGISLSIDDFGTGYSSLSYLKRFPIDTLKIDQAFVRDLGKDEDDAAITKAIIGMGHSLRLAVIAEGVETREQFDFLKRHHCDEIQGNFFSRPLPAFEFAGIMRNKLMPL